MRARQSWRFLILRANTEDDYAQQVNKEISAICPLNSVATIVFSDREDSDDPKVVEIIQQAEAIFFAGGDQSNYVRFWQDTPVQDALNRHISAGRPIGGSSAGLAILGEFSFASMIDTIHSPEALGDPYGNKVTLSRDFLRIHLLANTITDTHFAKRDRMGRLLVFLARILQDGWVQRRGPSRWKKTHRYCSSRMARPWPRRRVSPRTGCPRPRPTSSPSPRSGRHAALLGCARHRAVVRERPRYLGTIMIRHELTPRLRAEGGHIGYHVVPRTAAAGTPPPCWPARWPGAAAWA